MINTRPKYFTEKGCLPPNGIYFLKVAKEGELFSLRVINAFRAEMERDFTADGLVHAYEVVELIEKVAGSYSFNSIAGIFQPEDKPSQDEDVNKIVLSLRERGLTVKPVDSIGEGRRGRTK